MENSFLLPILGREMNPSKIYTKYIYRRVLSHDFPRQSHEGIKQIHDSHEHDQISLYLSFACLFHWLSEGQWCYSYALIHGVTTGQFWFQYLVKAKIYIATFSIVFCFIVTECFFCYIVFKLSNVLLWDPFTLQCCEQGRLAMLDTTIIEISK